MQLGWMREPGFQHTPIGINLAMLEAANTETMPLGHSMPSRQGPHIHTPVLACSQLNVVVWGCLWPLRRFCFVCLAGCIYSSFIIGPD